MQSPTVERLCLCWCRSFWWTWTSLLSKKNFLTCSCYQIQYDNENNLFVCWCVKPTHTERVSKYWHIRHYRRHKEYWSQWMLGCHNTVKQIELDGEYRYSHLFLHSLPRTNIMMSYYVILRNGMHTPHPQGHDHRLTPIWMCKGEANALLDPLIKHPNNRRQ